jgi:hypothetical protein
MKKKKSMDLKTISGNVLLVCGILTALCTAYTQVKDTFFKEPEKVAAPAPVSVTQNIIDAAGEVAVKKIHSLAPEVQQQQQEVITMSAAPEKPSYVWVYVLVLAGGAIIGGFYIRKQTVKEV